MGSLVAELAEKLSSATNNFDIDEGTIYVNTSADTVAIGGTSPDGKFSIHQSASADIMNLYDGTTAVFTVLDGGNVGMGTTAPNTLLHLNASSSTTTRTSVSSGGAMLTLENSSDADGSFSSILFQDNHNVLAGITGATVSAASDHGELRFFTNAGSGNVERMTINKDGNVGIGTTAPAVLAHAHSTATTALYLTTESNSSGDVEIWLGHNYPTSGDWASISFDTGDNLLKLNNSASAADTHFVIDDSGNVGLGVAPLATYSTLTSLRIGGNALIQHATAVGASASLEIGQNTHYDTDNSWEYISTDEASRYTQFAGEHIFFGAASGTAGDNISWTEALRIKVDGKVGIGSTSPNEKLDVAGAIMATGALGSHQTSAIVTHQVDTATSEIRAYGADASTAGILRLRGYANDGSPFNSGITLAADGNVGIGETSPAFLLHVAGILGIKATQPTLTLDRGGAYAWTIRNGDGTGSFPLSTLNVANNSGSPVMTFKDDGKVGIGTTAPETTLHVGDTASGTAGSTGKPMIVASTLATVYDGTSSASWQGLKVNNSDGTSNRTATGITFDHRTSSSGVAAIVSTSAAADTADLRFITRDGTGISEKMKMSEDGKLFSLPTYNNTSSGGANVFILHTTGELHRSTSSRRYKTNIVDSVKGLNELLTLRPVDFTSLCTSDDPNKLRTGFIAEEVAEAGFEEYAVRDENDDIQNVEYGHMVALCVKAIQELSAKVTTLENA